MSSLGYRSSTRSFIAVAIGTAVALIVVLVATWSAPSGRAASQGATEGARTLAADTAIRQEYPDLAGFANGVANNNAYDFRVYGQRILVGDAHSRAQRVLAAHAAARSGSALAERGLAVIQLPIRVRPQINFTAIVCPILQSILNAFASTPFFSFIAQVINTLLSAFGCNPPPTTTTSATTTTSTSIASTTTLSIPPSSTTISGPSTTSSSTTSTTI